MKETPTDRGDSLSPGAAAPGGVRRATRWSAAGRGIVIVVRWLVRLWLLTLIPVDEIGTMAVAMAVSGGLTLFADFGTGQAVVQRKQLDAAFLSTVFWLNLGLGVVLSAALWVGCLIAEQVLEPSLLLDVLPVLGLSFALLSLGIVQRNLLARKLEFGRIAVVNLVEAVAYGATAVILARSGHGIWALVYGTLAGAGGAVAASWVLGGWRPTLSFTFRVVREVWSFSMNLLGAQLTNYGLQQADRPIIYFVLGAEAAGFYHAAQQLVLYPIRNLTQVLVQVLVPALSRLQDDLERFRDRLLRAQAGVALVIAPCILGLAAVIDPLVRGFLRGDDGDASKWVAAIAPALGIMPAAFVRGLAATTGAVYVSQGATQLMFRWSLVLGGAVIAAYLVGLSFGLVGVAVAFSACHVLLAPWLFGVPMGLVGLRARDTVRVVSPAVLLALVMGGLVFGLQNGLVSAGVGLRWVTLLSVVAGVVLYGVGVLLRMPPGSGDLLGLLGLGRLARSRA